MRISPYLLWLLGPTSSGKTTIAKAFLEHLRAKGEFVIHYDGDEVRNLFGSSLGFSKDERLKVVKTLVLLANKAVDAGVNVIVSALTAHENARNYLYNNAKNLIVAYVECSIE